jgi:polar amino acid transport system substrate-binding protein
MKKFRYIIILIYFLLASASPLLAIHLSFTTQSLEPFSYHSATGAAGPSVDIVNTICDEMKADCIVDLYPWRRAYYEVQRGRANGIFFIGKNPEREKWLMFSPPIVLTEYGFFVNNNNPLVYKNPGDIEGYIVGVFGPSNTSASLQEIKIEMINFYIDMEDNDESGFRKLSVKRVNAVYSNRDVGYSLIKKLELSNIRYAGAHCKLFYYFAFNPKLTPTKWIEQFNATYRKLYHSGKIHQILQKFNMNPAPLD